MVVKDIIKNKEQSVINSSREAISEFQDILEQQPDAIIGDSDKYPLKHSFTDGVYIREMFIPKGYVIVGKLHKHSHPSFLLEGKVHVFTEQEGLVELVAPLSMSSEAGTKRVVYAIEDTIWVTVHLNPTNTTDLAELEDEIIAKDFNEITETKKEELL